MRTILAVLLAAVLVAGCDDGGSIDGPCKDIDCSGHGQCEENQGAPRCNCDTGYHPGADGLTCIENEPGCTDNDGDGYGEGCSQGADCNDDDNHHWSDCGACVDSDGDDYGAGCDLGDDCDDNDDTKWAACDDSALLTWDAPTTNADGTPLTDLAGYRVKYGTTSGAPTETVDVGNVTTHTVQGLASGTWYFVVTAVDTSGNESAPSNEASKTIP